MLFCIYILAMCYVLSKACSFSFVTTPQGEVTSVFEGERVLWKSTVKACPDGLWLLELRVLICVIYNLLTLS